MTRDDLNQNQRESRRERVRRARAERHGSGSEHRTRVCPECRNQIPYIDPLQDPAHTCGDCGYSFACPECRTEWTDDDRDEKGRPPRICPVCDYEVAPDREEVEEDEEFTWS